MKLVVKIGTALSLLALLIAAFLKYFVLPNQLLLVGAAIFLHLVLLVPTFAWANMKSSKGPLQKVLDVLVAFIIPIAMIAAYWGVLQQGLVPIVVFMLMMVAIIVYLVWKRQPAQGKKLVLSTNVWSIGLVFILLLVNSPFQQALPDTLFAPAVSRPEYKEGTGPVVFIDEAHNNYHTLNGLYRTLGNILEQDGYQVEPLSSTFSPEALGKARMLIISNAIHEKNRDNWNNPTFSAFTPEEVAAVQRWVKEGGSLLLIADHMPFGGAAKALAKAFGFEFSNGHADDTLRQDDYFYRASGSLHSNVITNGRTAVEQVDSIMSFSGHAFTIPEEATAILTFGSEYVQWEPERAWDLRDCSPKSVEGWAQGAYLEFGRGRVVVFGEAAMFTGQLGAGLSWFPVGLNDPKAGNNYQLLLNIIHWMDGRM